MKDNSKKDTVSASRDFLKVNVDIYVFKEHKYYVSYCPSLDICTSGTSKEDALANFRERFELYVETCLEKGTLWDDLKRHGWSVKKRSVTPPPFNVLVQKREVSDLLGGPLDYQKIRAPFRIASVV